MQQQQNVNDDESEHDIDDDGVEQINISANSVNINPLHGHQQQQQAFIAPPNRNSANTLKSNTEHSSRYNSAIPSNGILSNQTGNNPEQQLFNLSHDSVQPPPANMNMDNAAHRKSRSRVLPRSLKKKKFPKKKKKKKKKKKMNRGMNNNNQNGQNPNGQMTNFSDLNFNPAQNYQHPKNPTSANFQHGQTMYTAQW